MRVKHPRSLPRETSCTISVFLARLRARCLHTASPCFWSQCSLQDVSSRLMRSTALSASCRSVKFQNCQAASACRGCPPSQFDMHGMTRHNSEPFKWGEGERIVYLICYGSLGSAIITVRTARWRGHQGNGRRGRGGSDGGSRGTNRAPRRAEKTGPATSDSSDFLCPESGPVSFTVCKRGPDFGTGKRSRFGDRILADRVRIFRRSRPRRRCGGCGRQARRAPRDARGIGG